MYSRTTFNDKFIFACKHLFKSKGKYIHKTFIFAVKNPQRKVSRWFSFDHFSKDEFKVIMRI